MEATIETPAPTRADWRYHVRDVSQYVSPDLLAACGGVVYAVHVFDATSRTYCCEVTPSYAMFFLRHEPRALPDCEDARESVWALLMECDQDQDEVSYMHTSQVALGTCQRVWYVQDPEDTEDEQAAGVFEWARGNHEAQIPE